MSADHLTVYINLLSHFVAGDISAGEFESDYMSLFKNDPTHFREEEFLTLDELFGDVDAFCADPELRDDEDLDEEQLRRRSALALEKLKAIVPQSAPPVETAETGTG